jgi:hypothetical protein
LVPVGSVTPSVLWHAYHLESQANSAPTRNASMLACTNMERHSPMRSFLPVDASRAEPCASTSTTSLPAYPQSLHRYRAGSSHPSIPLDLKMFRLPHLGHTMADRLPRFSALTASMIRFTFDSRQTAPSVSRYLTRESPAAPEVYELCRDDHLEVVSGCLSLFHRRRSSS